MHAMRRPLAGRLAFFATVVGSLLLALATAGAAFGGDDKEAKTQDHKVTLCHAAGLAGTTHYVTITIARQAAEHHLDPDTGTSRAGHEDDYLGPCKVATPPPPPPPGDNKGFLEICKQADGSGVTGTFDFSVGGQTVTVPVGACSFPIQLPAGTATVTELARDGFQVTGISANPPTRLVESDVTTGTARVTIVPGDVGTQTIVTFRNRKLPIPIQFGLLKVCKRLGSGVTLGTIFRFTVNGDPISVPAGFCVIAGAFPVGTEVTVDEAIPAGMEVTSIVVNPVSRLVGTPNLETGVVTAAVGTGVTEVIFTNRVPPAPPPQTGWLQICKEADGTGVTGSFTFTVAGQTHTVPVGACTQSIQLPAGQATITETIRSGFEISGISTIPANRLVSSNPVAGTATVTIVPGDVSTQTVVIFRNRKLPPPTGELRICKVAGTGVATGTNFTFSVAGENVVVPAGHCVNAGRFLIGANVTVDEAIPAGLQVTGIVVSPLARQVGSPNLATGVVTVEIGTGVTQVTYTNALIPLPPPPPPEKGHLKICKIAGTGVATGTLFTFTAGGQTFNVPAGSCVLAGMFTVGTEVTVDEVVPANHQVTAITVDPANRLVGAPNLSTGTVTARIGSGFTEVRFTNRRLEGGPGGNQPPICPTVFVGINTIQVTVQAPGGLQSIVVNRPPTTNVNVSIPAFTVGTTGPVVVTATRVNRGLPARLELTVTDVSGRSVVCDPILTTLRAGKAQTFRGLPQAESKITVKNGRPGVRSVIVIVNGKRFQLKNLRPGRTRTLNVVRAMRAGNTNTITVRALGRRGASATIVISD